jgi:hypothetical protein
VSQPQPALAPDQVVTKTLWTVRIRGDNLGVFGPEHTFPPLDEMTARQRLAFYREHRPDIISQLLVCEQETRRGPWRPVDG